MANSMDMEFDLKDFDLREISRFVLGIEAFYEWKANEIQIDYRNVIFLFQFLFLFLL